LLAEVRQVSASSTDDAVGAKSNQRIARQLSRASLTLEEGGTDS